MKFTLFVLISTGILLFGTGEAFACLCNPQTPKQRVKDMKINADAIFVGTVESVEGDQREVKAVLKIAKAWKGRDVETLIIYTSRSECGVYFEEGKSYIVYAKGDENKRLMTSVCFGSGITDFARQDFKRLGNPCLTGGIRNIEAS